MIDLEKNVKSSEVESQVNKYLSQFRVRDANIQFVKTIIVSCFQNHERHIHSESTLPKENK